MAHSVHKAEYMIKKICDKRRMKLSACIYNLHLIRKAYSHVPLEWVCGGVSGANFLNMFSNKNVSINCPQEYTYMQRFRISLVLCT